jgi:hypothetical protein
MDGLSSAPFLRDGGGIDCGHLEAGAGGDPIAPRIAKEIECELGKQNG